MVSWAPRAGSREPAGRRPGGGGDRRRRTGPQPRRPVGSDRQLVAITGPHALGERAPVDHTPRVVHPPPGCAGWSDRRACSPPGPLSQPPAAPRSRRPPPPRVATWPLDLVELARNDPPSRRTAACWGAGGGKRLGRDEGQPVRAGQRDNRGRAVARPSRSRGCRGRAG